MRGHCVRGKACMDKGGNKMREAILTIRENKRIARGTFRMILEGSCDKVLPGSL